MTYGEQVREAAERLLNPPRESYRYTIPADEDAQLVARAVLSMLRPEAPKDERDFLVGALRLHGRYNHFGQLGYLAQDEAEALADSLIAAGWRRNP